MNALHKLAQGLLRHADEFRRAAERLSAEEPFLYHPTFYTVLHSIELGLKTHLALVGYTKKQLASKALGHNLGALVSEGHKSGAIPFLDAPSRRAITTNGKSYSEKCFEYPEFMVSTLPIGRWLRFAELLTSQAQLRVPIEQ